MADVNLYALLHGLNQPYQNKKSQLKAPVQQDRYELAILESISQRVDDLLAAEGPAKNLLISVAMRRTQLIQQEKEALALTEFGEQLALAVHILQTEGLHYLNQEENDSLVQGLSDTGHRLKNLNLNFLDDETLQNALSISSDHQALILRIGLAKFNQDCLAESLSIFALLTFLDSKQPDYWYRLGLVAQKSKRYDLAARAYNAAAEFAPNFISIHIFAAQCYVECGQLNQALDHFYQAKNISNSSVLAEPWQALLMDLENLILLSNR